ncbi:MAG: hypothetical protein EBS31_05000 [Burkholderiaceae bacterium]|nr:hypothetical protein [Burkholderiaceae bacterium]
MVVALGVVITIQSQKSCLVILHTVMLNWLSKYSADAIVLRQADKTWGKEAILQTVSALVASLRSRLEPYAPVGILGDNHPEWLMIDWACQEAGVALIPLPTFFTPSQWVHTIRQSGMTSLFVPACQSFRFCFSNHRAESKLSFI